MFKCVLLSLLYYARPYESSLPAEYVNNGAILIIHIQILI